MVNFKIHKLQNQNCQNPEYLLFIIHGYGDSGGGILHAFNDFSENFQNFLLVAPDGQHQHGYSDGYEWFNLDSIYADRSKTESVFAEGVNDVLYLQEFIESEAKKYNINFNKIFLAGFSQGAFIVNHLALISKKQFAGVISLSGGISISGLEKAGINPKNNPTEFCIIHGASDKVLQASISEHSADFLNQNNIKNKVHILPEVEHTINREIMDIAMDFVKKKIG